MRVRTPIDLGLVIRERRRSLGLDQRALAAKVGVNRQWVIDLEKGRPGAGLGLVLQALDLLGLRLSVETGASETPTKRPTTRLPPIDIDAVIDRARGKAR